mmetsp:Transcript_20752/g.44873  ORF Transcript_20752/g.44873 Transcript_20752/m.44873 type:complete len:528 (-) Transcript_20752:1377-2960(-)
MSITTAMAAAAPAPLPSTDITTARHGMSADNVEATNGATTPTTTTTTTAATAAATAAAIKRQWRKRRSRPLHRLRSIVRDSVFVQRVVEAHRTGRCTFELRFASSSASGSRSSSSAGDAANATTVTAAHNWPVVANQRCGSWYVGPALQLQKQTPLTSPSTSPLPSSSETSESSSSKSPSSKSSKSSKSSSQHHQGSYSCHHSCYFKSTDGHVGTWSFSLKRLNLNLLDVIVAAQSPSVANTSINGSGGGGSGSDNTNIKGSVGGNDGNSGAVGSDVDSGGSRGVGGGGCFIIDSSKTKLMPDSLSRTVPIWCSVINCAVVYYARRRGVDLDGEVWYTAGYTGGEADGEADAADIGDDEGNAMLFTPSQVVTAEEHAMISGKIPSMVRTLISSDIIDVDWLLGVVTKPLRPYWITNSLPQPGNGCEDGDGRDIGVPEYDTDSYLCVVCVSCSNIDPSLRVTEPWYTPGAADDEESWARGLTPSLFWSNRDSILFDDGDDNNGGGGSSSSRRTDGDTDRIIKPASLYM